ncbi:MAG: FMN-binding protein [Deltaproteobacteria bacterium]|nr:FMN-binding protein [Deltaproteobacteria bacterium]
MAERGSRDGIVNDALPKGSKATWTQTIYVPVQGDKRLGYVVEGITQGFKRPIKLMVSLDPQFTVTGLAILEHEEDPGLGAEIVQDYFKNQFAGKTLDVLKNLKVVKEPLPEDYLPALEPARAQKAAIRADKIKEIKDKYLKSDIYAITGATISSRAVTNGVTNSVRKFVYRLGILSEAIKQENLQVAF